MALMPTVLPTVPVTRLASYSRPVAKADPSAAPSTSASSQLGQYANQQLGGLTQTPTVAASGITPPTSTPVTPFTAPKTAVGIQLQKTQDNLAAGAQRVNQLYAFRTQQKASQTGMYAGGGKVMGASGKGQIATPDSRLTAVGRGQYLANSAAAALSNLNAAYHAATGGNISVTEGWRSLSTQQRYYALHQAGIMKQAVARPGTSVHGTGNAADLGGIGNPGSKSFNWLVNNAQNYGWSWVGKNFGESWHWEYIG